MRQPNVPVLTQYYVRYYTKVCKLISIITGSRKRLNSKLQKQLAPYEFRIITNTCVGGVFLHDANKRFNSPTVNLAIDGEGFMHLLENLDLLKEGVFENKGFDPEGHPFALLDGAPIHFVHYKDGVAKWKSRAERLLSDHIYIMATPHNGFERVDLMERFDNFHIRRSCTHGANGIIHGHIR